MSRRSCLGCWPSSRCDRWAFDWFAGISAISGVRTTNHPHTYRRVRFAQGNGIKAGALLEEGCAGLTRESVAMAHQLRAVSKQRLAQKLGRIDNQEILKALQKAMRIQLDL